MAGCTAAAEGALRAGCAATAWSRARQRGPEAWMRRGHRESRPLEGPRPQDELRPPGIDALDGDRCHGGGMSTGGVGPRCWRSVPWGS